MLNQYPDSKFAQIIRKPNVKQVEEKKIDEVLNRYKEIYVIYKLNKFDGGLMKYWVDSHDYGVVETAHQILLHSILGEDD